MTQARSARFDLLMLAALSSVLVLYHILTSAFSRYGYFIDEFYYVACSKHLAFGYVDHPPLSIFLLSVSRWIFGDSLVATRLFSALAVGATAFLTGVIGGVVFLPAFTPLLPPPVLKNYLSTLGLSFDIEIGKRNEALPQWLADRLGWHELASDVGEVYRALPPRDRQNAVIISTNYGEAGALELYGTEFDLPPVFATHNSYHSWGPPADSVKTFIAVFVNRRDLEGRFESVAEATVHTCEFCSRPQRSIPIYVARGPRFSMAAEWPKFKIYN